MLVSATPNNLRPYLSYSASGTNLWKTVIKISACLERLKGPIGAVLAGLLGLGIVNAHANKPPDIITHIGLADLEDKRRAYEINLLRLSLELTREEYGEYRLRAAPVGMTQARMLVSMQENRYTNYIATMGFNERLTPNMGLEYVRFPTQLGIVGYRVCFTSAQAAEGFAKANSLVELRQFLHGQGVGWPDANILRHNGFRVKEVGAYKSLFKMTAEGRVDAFCRGANEVQSELEQRSHLKGLKLDRDILIYYSHPLFYFTNSQNKQLVERVEKGLFLAYENGSLLKLWWDSFGNSLEFSGLERRKIFEIHSPYISMVDFDYRKYMFTPEKLIESSKEYKKNKVKPTATEATL